MKTSGMKFLSVLMALAFVSCDEPPPPHSRPVVELPAPPHEEAGPELTEKGKVLEIAFRLGSTTTTTAQSQGYNKTIAKSWIDDPIGLHNKTVRVPGTSSSNTVTVEDQFAVIFECQHGKFIVESLGKESKAGLLWKKLKQGDSVDIRYKEVFYVVPATGEKEMRRYEFVDANTVK